jgi:hypothetical protein
MQMSDDNITDLGEARGRKFLNDLEAGKCPAALTAGYKPIEDFVDWYLENGYSCNEALHAFAYSAAAQLFRDLPRDEAAVVVTDTFVSIVSELLRYGPHRGDEAYGGKPTKGQMEEVFATLQGAVDRYKELCRRIRAEEKNG